MRKMNEIKESETSEYVRIENQGVTIRKWWDGNIDISIYNLSGSELEAIASITGSKVHINNEVRWIRFARSRDGSRVVLFQE